MAKGFSFANHIATSIFTELSKSPARFDRFANAMAAISDSEGFEPEILVKAFPWEEMGAKRFVDIGGSHGKLGIALAQNSRDTTCIVQDLSEVVAEGKCKLPASLTGRVIFMVHDFFTEQPIKEADVYFLRWVLHDWSDTYCVKILRCLIPALKKGARIIISEMTIPPPGLVSQYQEWVVR